jgi:hypothetical protein
LLNFFINGLSCKGQIIKKKREKKREREREREREMSDETFNFFINLKVIVISVE